MRNERKSILCPACGRKVGEYDGRSTIPLKRSCQKCVKMVVYDMKTGNTDIKDLPPRKSSSGVMFI